jgi:hypothetical protein
LPMLCDCEPIGRACWLQTLIAEPLWQSAEAGQHFSASPGVH